MTPLELAQRILAAESPSGMGWSEACKTVAAALVERMTPFEVSVLTLKDGCVWGSCVCGDSVQYQAGKFCPNCGKPLVWK